MSYLAQSPSPHLTPPDGRGSARVPLADRFKWCLQALLHRWQAVRYWLQAMTGAAQHPPAGRHRPLTAYLLALLVNAIAISLAVLLVVFAPASDLFGVVLLVGIVVVALICGVGPSAFATGLDLLLLVGVVLTGTLSGRQDPADWIFVVVLVASEIGLSLLAGQSNWSRRKVEALADSLSATKTTSDLERKRLEEALRQAEREAAAQARELGTIVEALTDGLLVYDAEGRILRSNAAARALLGFDAHPEFAALPWMERIARYTPLDAQGKPIPPGDLALSRLLRGEVLTGAQTAEDFLHTPDGREVSFGMTGRPLRDAEGTIIGAVGIVRDETERRRLERQAAERAAQLETTFESIADGVVVTDRQGRIVHMNQALRTLLGLEQDPTGWTLPELEGLAGFANYTPAGQHLIEGEDPFPRVLDGEVLTNRQSVDTVVRTAAGREILVNTTGAPIRDTTGHLLGGVFVARDVTAQRRFEQHTRDSLDALLAMAEALVQGHDQTEQGISALDPAFRPGTDPALSEMAARLAELTRHVLDCRSVSIVAVDAQTEAVTPVTVVGRSRVDEQRWWAGWERERAGEEQSHLRDVLPPEAIATLQAGELVVPERLPESFHCWQRPSQMCASVLVPMRIGETLVGALQIEHEHSRHWEASGDADTGSAEQKGALVRAVARLGALVLERERLLRERTQAQATELALRATQAQMEAFLATAAHDLRSPLTAVVGYLDLAQRQSKRLAAAVWKEHPDLASGVEGVRDRVEDAGQSAKRLTRLITLLFDMAALRTDRLELHRAPCDLATLVREQVAAVRVAAPERTIRLHLPVGDAPVPVEADADRLGQVVTNYVTNALKYSPTDQPVDVTVAVRGRRARVAVCDQGPGLPKEEQARVWDLFHRVPGVTARDGAQGGSLGLGLHISRGIVTAHGGRVGLHSVVGQGSTFWFTLPLASARSISAGAAA